MKPIILIAATLLSTPVYANGYLTDSEGNPVRNGFGECWRTGYWTPAMATKECDPDLVSAQQPTSTVKELAYEPTVSSGAPASTTIIVTEYQPPTKSAQIIALFDRPTSATRFKTIVKKKSEILTAADGKVTRKETIEEIIEPIPEPEPKGFFERIEVILGILGSIVTIAIAFYKIGFAVKNKEQI